MANIHLIGTIHYELNGTKRLKKALQVHHIDCDKDNLNPNNLTSLCNSCHRILHWQLRREE